MKGEAGQQGVTSGAGAGPGARLLGKAWNTTPTPIPDAYTIVRQKPSVREPEGMKKGIDRRGERRMMENMKTTRAYQMQIRLSQVELAQIRQACEPLGLKATTYVRTVLMRELARTFPADQGAKDRMLEAIAEMARQVVGELSRGTQPRKARRA